MQTTIDITKDHCPMTFVKVKLALAKLASGDVLDILMRGQEPFVNIPKAAAEQGHSVLEANEVDGIFHVVLQKG